VSKGCQKKIVLVIEDDADCRNFISRVLQLEGYDVLQAKDDDFGIQIARETPVALILLDLRLPGCDGWSVLTEMKNDSELSEIPVVVITASAEISKRERALSMGAANYLVKPLSAASLRKAIANVPLKKEWSEPLRLDTL